MINISNKNKILLAFLVFGIITILTGFNVGFYYGEYNRLPSSISGLINIEKNQPEEVDFSLFWDTWRELEKKSIHSEKLDFQKMVYGAISGMVKSLNDPYTVFFNPDDSKKFQEEVSGTFEGIGAEIGQKKGQIVIIAPLQDSPAQKSGLKAGDKIIKINDKFASDMNLEEAVSNIRGPKGTEVVLTVLRKEWDAPKEIKITREVIQVPSLKWELKKSGDEQFAYIRLYQFSEKADIDFRKAAFEILKSPAQKIILDLRDNPGGYLEVAQDISGWFLERNQIVVIEDFGKGKNNKEYKAEGNAQLARYPIVILMNKGSASAAEILAGALRDNRGAKIIGETSFGKGSVQELESLKNGSSLKITIAKWLTPKGQYINEQGLQPDVKVEITESDFQESRDPQLDKAIEIIKDLR